MVCDEMDIKYKGHHLFTADMGGYSDNDEWWDGSAICVETNQDVWIKVKKGNKMQVLKNTLPKKPYYTTISNQYAILPQFAADPPPSTQQSTTKHNKLPSIPSTFKCKARRRALARQLKRNHKLAEDELLTQHITWAEDERTDMATEDVITNSIHNLMVLLFYDYFVILGFCAASCFLPLDWVSTFYMCHVELGSSWKLGSSHPCKSAMRKLLYAAGAAKICD